MVVLSLAAHEGLTRPSLLRLELLLGAEVIVTTKWQMFPRESQ